MTPAIPAACYDDHVQALRALHLAFWDEHLSRGARPLTTDQLPNFGTSSWTDADAEAGPWKPKLLRNIYVKNA